MYLADQGEATQTHPSSFHIRANKKENERLTERKKETERIKKKQKRNKGRKGEKTQKESDSLHVMKNK